MTMGRSRGSRGPDAPRMPSQACFAPRGCQWHRKRNPARNVPGGSDKPLATAANCTVSPADAQLRCSCSRAAGTGRRSGRARRRCDAAFNGTAIACWRHRLQGVHVVGAGPERRHARLRVQIPHRQRAGRDGTIVEAPTAGHEATIGQHSQHRDGSIVACERHFARAGCKVPHLDGCVSAASHQPAVGQHRHRGNLVIPIAACLGERVCGHIPECDAISFRDCDPSIR